MKKLTENLIQQRLKTCTTDLDKVLQINITGRELQDVSLLRKMTGVEILSFSVNQISSLSDFQYCKNLKELYLRNNNISDLQQIYYLKNLPKLKLLMLSQNPCTNDPLYRPTVVKNLQYLAELDGIPISAEERQKALNSGISLKSNSFSALERHSSEEIQVRGSPPVRTPSDTEKEKERIDIEVSETSSKHELVSLLSNRMSLDLLNHVELSDRSLKIPTACEMCHEKEMNQSPKQELKGVRLLSNLDKPPRPFLCKFCKSQGSNSVFGIRIMPKNSNVLSATLNLVKELDYSSLQIVQAEIISLLNTFEVDFVCRGKK